MKKSLLLLSGLPLVFLAGCKNEPQIVKKYTVQFMNADGQLLQKSEVEEGAYPVYEQEIPSLDPIDEHHEYIYIGWDKELEKVSQDITYTAEYDNVFLFGTYPQTLVSDPKVIADIEQTTSGPDDFGYYQDSKGNLYYKFAALCNYTADDGTKVEDGSENYYEVQPIKWKILGDEAQGFYTTYSLLDLNIFNSETPDPAAEYPNNYRYSEIRKWMNSTDENGFMWRAFSAKEQSDIKTHTVVNNLDSTKDILRDGEQTKYTCPNTEDQVFSLSRAELWDPNLGFAEGDSLTKTRLAKTTDLARAKKAAIYKNNGAYWTRSPAQNSYCVYDYFVYYTMVDSYVSHLKCSETGICVRPAIRLV